LLPTFFSHCVIRITRRSFGRKLRYASFAPHSLGVRSKIKMDSAFAYEKNAHEFLRGRDKSPIGTGVVQQWARTLPRSTEVLEIACGGGYPVTKELKKQ
jgi:hypothetical protein